MELRINDYVRTTSGKIYKITDFKKYYINEKLIIEKQLVYIDNRNSCLNYEQFCKLIIKNSPNIIDLIEVGDYVNGRLVHKNDDEDYLYLIGFDADGNFYEDSIKDVKSIVTKEQFEKMTYKIGD